MKIQFANMDMSYKSLIVPLIISTLALFFWIFASLLEPYGIYDKQAINNGEIWRLLTAHLFHTNGYHLLLNIVGVLLLWLLHGKFYSNKSYTGLLFFSGIIVSGGLFFFSTLLYYVGLSGVLHGVFAWGALKDIENKDKTGYLLLLGLLAKIVHEQLQGASEDLIKLIDANVAIDAHLYGAIAGGCFYFIQRLQKK